MSQSRKMSLLEAKTNMVFGFLISWSMWSFVIGPLAGYETGIHSGFWITVAFTVTSVFRSYSIRRLFNWIGERHAVQKQ